MTNVVFVGAARGTMPGVRGDGVRDPKIPTLYSLTQAAKALGMARQSVWQMILEGRLPASWVGGDGERGLWVLREEAVLRKVAEVTAARARAAKARAADEPSD